MRLNRARYYILKGKEPVEATAEEWSVWFSTADRHVAKTQVGEYWVSTVFMGLDHNFSGRGAPVLFETMTFDLDNRQEMMGRCSTWAEADAMHAMAVAHVRQTVTSG